MKFLLLAPPKTALKMFSESPPVGLGYLATVIRKLGYEVDIKDCLVENWDNEQTLEYIKKYNPDIIGINVFSTAIHSVQELIKGIRGSTIILGGPHCTGDPENVFKLFPQADFAVRGEGEIPLMDFNEYLTGKRRMEDVRGLITRNFINEPVEHTNIEDFGLPAWDLIDPRKYFKEVNVGDKSINVHFSRGCPFSCRFCVKLGTKVRFRSLEHIWKEIEHLNSEYGVERFIINDEGYTMFPKFVKEFCKFAISKGNKYRFFTATGLRLNRLDDEMLELMKEARHELSFGVGIESAVPRVREELMNKKLTQDELDNGLKLLNKHGFKPVGNFILGFPGETRQELIQTVKWACNNKYISGANFVPFLPLPGALATKNLIKSGKLPPDFDYAQMGFMKVVYAPDGMTIDELDRLRRWAVFKYNMKPKMLWHFISDKSLFKRAVISFLRLFLPNNWLPEKWRRM